MSYELRSPVENFLNWESNKGKETFLIQPIYIVSLHFLYFSQIQSDSIHQFSQNYHTNV